MTQARQVPLRHDLVGLAGGETEELTERTVRERYLIGILEPSRSGVGRGASDGKAPPVSSPNTPLDDDDDDESPAIPDELSEGGSDSADDRKTDTDTPVTVAPR